MILLSTVFLAYLINFLHIASSQTGSEVYTNHIYDKSIKTVQLYKEGWNLSYPVIMLRSDERLVLNFDLLGDKTETYYYTFVHCDKDWNRSNLIPNDYIQGFAENPVENYNNSFNTTVHYVHYTLTFPNQQIKFTISGNYVLVVYPFNEPDNPAFTQRFVVTEEAVDISVQTHRPKMTADLDAYQQVDFIVNYSQLRINNPYQDIYAFILQNGRWDKAKKNLKPVFYGNNELNYTSLGDNNIFPGGNEFRYFDIKSIRYKTEYVKNIDFLFGNYHVYLFPSENREFKPYFYWQDLNGKYYVAVQEEKNPDTDADYVYVDFTLPSLTILSGGKMYVSGAFNDWEYNENNLMTYNENDAAYECMILLKQGWYNYEYEFVSDTPHKEDLFMFEGSHYETENDYTVLVYYRNPFDRYDRVLGVKTVNTLNKITD
jgi:hypothetical protein